MELEYSYDMESCQRNMSKFRSADEIFYLFERKSKRHLFPSFTIIPLDT